MDHTTCCTYTAVFSRELSNAIWKNDREVPNFNFFQLYHYFVVITEKYNGNLLRRTSYKRLKSFQFFTRVISKQWSYVPLNYVHSKVKLSMKNKCYNVIVEYIRESEDIIARLVLALLDQVSSVLENAIILVLFVLLWKILIEKI